MDGYDLAPSPHPPVQHAAKVTGGPPHLLNIWHFWCGSRMFDQDGQTLSTHGISHPAPQCSKVQDPLIYTMYHVACEDMVINTFCLKADTSQIITCRCSKSFMWVRQMRAIETDFVARECRKQQQENTIESLDTLMALMNWSSNITAHICSFYLALQFAPRPPWLFPIYLAKWKLFRVQFIKWTHMVPTSVGRDLRKTLTNVICIFTKRPFHARHFLRHTSHAKYSDPSRANTRSIFYKMAGAHLGDLGTNPDLGRTQARDETNALCSISWHWSRKCTVLVPLYIGRVQKTTLSFCEEHVCSDGGDALVSASWFVQIQRGPEHGTGG